MSFVDLILLAALPAGVAFAVCGIWLMIKLTS